MKRSAILAILILWVPAAVAADVDALAADSREAIKAFASALQGELKTAMEAGGPVNAIAVCNTRAGEIAATVSDARGLDVARRSLRNRSPGNAPSDWERAVLEDFEARKAAGEDAAALEYAAVVETGAGREFRFMKAIPTGELCLRCHGTDIAPEVAERLDALYPEDKARGFSIGDLRGAFRVIKPL